jgi:hypothetical protein
VDVFLHRCTSLVSIRSLSRFSISTSSSRAEQFHFGAALARLRADGPDNLSSS